MSTFDTDTVHRSWQPPTGPRLVTQQQAADELQVSERSVRRYVRDGYLEGVRVGPRMIRITRESLNRMVNTAMDRPCDEQGFETA